MQHTAEFLPQLTKILEMYHAGYLAIRDKTIPAEKRATVMPWFQGVLAYFKIFGHHTGFNAGNLPPDIVHPAYRHLSVNVSINSFCLVEISNLNAQIFTHRWPDRDHWNHPGVHDFMMAMLDGSLRRHLHLVGKIELWVVAKFFCNTISGALLDPFVPLDVDHVSWWSSKKPYDVIVDRILEDSGQGERLVCAESDVLVFACPLEAIDPKINVRNRVVLSQDIMELNRVCRKLKINIVK